MSEELEDKFSDSIEKINLAWKDVTNQLTQSNKEIAEMKEKFADSQAIMDQKDKAFKELEVKYNEAQSKVDHIESQLAQNINKLDSISKAKRKDIDALQLLDIYLVLMEQVFESGAHVRLLLMLHGDADEYSLTDLARASGISPIAIRQAMFELRNANIVNFDEETQIITLKQRFLN